ncbi:MAG TPA: hypothetical protein VFQ53_42555 [Kofleriaceae bacterium]|nr:hypothetical protein [Kofleriaceae bacterium]
MNAMAAVGTVQRAPEIVIVNDGKPVENVGHKSTGATIARLAIPAAIALILGIAIGKIGESASSYNSGLSDAKAILGDKTTPSTVASLKQTLSQIDTLLDDAKKNQFRYSAKLDAELEKLVQKLDVKQEVVFRAKQNALDADVSSQILTFYSGIAEVKSMVDTHLKSAKADALAFKKAKDKQDEASLKEGENAPLAGSNNPLRYGVMLQAPTEQDKVEFGAKIVEIGGVYCGAGGSPTTKCNEGEAPSAFAYRAEPGATWTKGDLAQGGTDSVPTKKVVQLLPGGVRDSLIKGSEGVASEVYYQRRLRTLYERICKRDNSDKCQSNTLLDVGNKLESRLQAESSKGTRFSFFM